MEAAPPSYETATLINPWDLVAEWLPSNDLCSCALVCGAWHSIFTPHLWGNPAAHFGTENDRVYIALTKFQRTLPWARRYVRAFTHTLHLPPASAEIYYGPHDGWLRDVLERLENLQTLIVRGLPFFDHGALTALRPKPNQDAPLSSPQSFTLRLLDASKCANTTTSGLLAALKRLDQLLYLDLSFTYPAKDRQVLSQLSNFAGLQVLKLRGISLKDEDVQILAKAIGARVRSLDLRNNKLSDQSVRYLTESCFTPYAVNDANAAQRRVDGERASLLHYLGPNMLRIYQGEGFEGYLRHSLSAQFVSRLAFEDTPESGITHLYVSDNNLSVEGVSGLLRTRRLHVLQARVDTHLPNKLMQAGGKFEIIYPGAEKLPLTLAKDYGANLTFLKMDHEIITKEPPDYHPETAVPGRVELADTAIEDDGPALPPRHVELEDTSFTPELPPENTRSELAGTDPHVPLPLRIKDTSSTTSSPAEQLFDDPPIKRGSIFAPEPVSALSEIPSSPSLSVPIENNTHTTVSSISQTLSYPTYSSSPSAPTFTKMNPRLSPGPDATLYPPPTSQPTSTPKPRSYSSLTTTRRARRLALDSTTYHPSTTPHLRTLVLSSFPSHSSTHTPITRLISFLTACASESLLATQLSETDYSLPPHQRSQLHRREAAKKLFALETIILEVVPTNQDRRPSGWKGKSMTDDRDSADLWRTAESDFSFFGEEGETIYPTIMDGRGGFESGLEVAPAGMGEGAKGKGKVEGREEWVDNIAELGKWRRLKKGEWERGVERAKAMGNDEMGVEVEGYWPGVVRVVRLTGRENDEEGEERDYYGNVCSSSGVYR
ncbi:Hypothetical protein D9617_4g003820 [Elsinoe fawcettii]|nr:Hypothetical protein D9617_4g003820 [Elsinoe fawcettii]